MILKQHMIADSIKDLKREYRRIFMELNDVVRSTDKDFENYSELNNVLSNLDSFESYIDDIENAVESVSDALGPIVDALD